MEKKLDIKTGDRYGRLVVIKQVESVRSLKTNKPSKKYLFKCDCGNEKEILLNSVRQNVTKSCGCLLKELALEKSKTILPRIKHGHNFTNKRTPTYITWVSMKQRCLNPNLIDYKNYGGRGIEVCNKWMKFKGFLEDMGERKKGTTIDRINVNGNYELSNCRWATIIEQNNNRRNVKNV